MIKHSGLVFGACYSTMTPRRNWGASHPTSKFKASNFSSSIRRRFRVRSLSDSFLVCTSLTSPPRLRIWVTGKISASTRYCDNIKTMNSCGFFLLWVGFKILRNYDGKQKWAFFIWFSICECILLCCSVCAW